MKCVEKCIRFTPCQRDPEAIELLQQRTEFSNFTKFVNIITLELCLIMLFIWFTGMCLLTTFEAQGMG